jgi:hypothetical protein
MSQWQERSSVRALLTAVVLVVAALAGHAHAEPRQFTFSWPFEEGDAMRPRGGTTRGAR